jgi:hypothetical protein
MSASSLLHLSVVANIRTMRSATAKIFELACMIACEVTNGELMSSNGINVRSIYLVVIQLRTCRTHVRDKSGMLGFHFRLGIQSDACRALDRIHHAEADLVLVFLAYHPPNDTCSFGYIATFLIDTWYILVHMFNDHPDTYLRMTKQIIQILGIERVTA